MKKLITFTLAATFITASFISCKKGDHDPFLSLRSRKARLEGSWTLTHQDRDELSVNPNTTVKTSSIYDGTMEISSVTTTSGTVANTSIDTVFYEYTLTIEKDGTFKQLYKNNNNLDLTEIEGTWMFIGKSKLNKLKNKEAILLTTTKSTILYNGFTNVVDYTDLNGRTLVIDQLKNDEMIITEQVDSNNEDGLSSDKSLIKMTFTQK